jgi:hypothetical protein
VVVSQGIAGRFGIRSSLYAFQAAGERIPVERRQVVLVLSDAGIDDAMSYAGTDAAVVYARTRLHLHDVGGAGVHVFVWSPPPGTRAVTLP